MDQDEYDCMKVNWGENNTGYKVTIRVNINPIEKRETRREISDTIEED